MSWLKRFRPGFENQGFVGFSAKEQTVQHVSDTNPGGRRWSYYSHFLGRGAEVPKVTCPRLLSMLELEQSHNFKPEPP